MSIKVMNEFKALLDIATDPWQLETNDDAIVQICDMFDVDDFDSWTALQDINKKIMDKNPHTVKFSLQVLENIFFKCGKLVQKRVCTTQYMDFFKNVIDTTQHKAIKEIIITLLKSWADNLKCFARERETINVLLNKLENEKNDNKLMTLNKMIENNEPYSNAIETNNNVDNGTSKINKSCNSDIKEEKEDYISAMEELKKIRKQQHRQFRREAGKPTSSDEEEDAALKRQETAEPISLVKEKDAAVKKHDSNTDSISLQQKKSENAEKKFATPHKLPKDLEKVKNQRKQLVSACQEVRALKHEQFLQHSNNNGMINQEHCTDENCGNCKMYKRKNEEAESIPIPKQLPLEMRKVKESKVALNKSIKEVRELKHRAHQNGVSSVGASLVSGHQRRSSNREVKNQNASVPNENQARIGFGDWIEDRELQEALRRSCIETEIHNDEPNFDHED